MESLEQIKPYQLKNFFANLCTISRSYAKNHQAMEDLEAQSEKLKNQGFDIMHASDGDEALTLLGEHAFDLILLDIIMPNRDGFEVLRRMKKKIPAYILTNLCQEEDAAMCKKLGAQRFFIKSETSLNDVVHHIKKLFT